jgi:hypothetical protein
LVGTFKKNISVPQTEWEKIEKVLQEIKNKASAKKLDMLIQFCVDLLTRKSQSENRNNQSPPQEAPHPQETQNKEISQAVLKYVENLAEVIKPALGKKDETEGNKILTDLLEIFKNFKKQAELKNKGKKSGGSNPKAGKGGPKSE